ncbi:HMCN [Mytilus edulis]|uniref:HMCN n=1 Tax=Mytilus edulis TaxID=6550 RepID=A0A8S3VQX3_MYTED|nr:HMCN [Mytilus edulis]
MKYLHLPASPALLPSRGITYIGLEKLKSYAREITGGVTVFILKNSTNVWEVGGKIANVVKEAEINENESNPVSEPGSCTDQTAGYTCKCSAEYTGKTCEINLECRSSPCLNGGLCTDNQLSGHTCHCPLGYTGYNCEKEGIPVPSITWESLDKPSLPRIHYNWHIFLVILNVSIIDGGHYMCTAKNKVGTDIKVVEVIVRAKHSNLIAPVIHAPSSVQAKYYLEGRLTCNVTGFPTPTVIWKHNNKIVQSSGNTLVIHSVTNATTGSYSCIATNGAGTSQANIQLKVSYDVPKIVTPPVTSVLMAGHSHNFTCIATGHPKPTIKWTYKMYIKHTTDMPSHQLYDNGSVLMLYSINTQESGQLTCTARNEFEKTTFLFLLLLEHMDVVWGCSSHGTFHHVYGGCFSCDCDHGFRDHVVNLVHINDCYGNACHHGTCYDGIGSYSCGCHGGYTGSHCDRAPSIMIKPIVTLANIKTVLEGSSVLTILCNAEGIPIPSVTWESLEVSNNNAYGGHYVCTAKNRVGIDVKVVQVIVKANNNAPHEVPVIHAPPVIQVKYYTEARITCNVTGSPKPNVAWIHNDIFLNVSFLTTDTCQSSGNTLVVHSVTNATTGIYTCIATNDAGSNVPKIVSPPVTSVIMAGHAHNFTCIATGHPEPTIIWTFNMYTKHTTDMPSHQLLKNDSVLTLNSLSTQESGLLTCTAQNEFGEAHVSISVIVRSQGGGLCGIHGTFENFHENYYSCHCDSGYGGQRCNYDVDECASNPCLHSGICHNYENRFTCTCKSGYTGRICELDVDECASNPCLHSGNATIMKTDSRVPVTLDTPVEFVN